MSKKNLKGKERDGDSKDQEKRVEKVRRGKGRREAPPVWLRSTAPDDGRTRTKDTDERYGRTIRTKDTDERRSEAGMRLGRAPVDGAAGAGGLAVAGPLLRSIKGSGKVEDGRCPAGAGGGGVVAGP